MESKGDGEVKWAQARPQTPLGFTGRAGQGFVTVAPTGDENMNRQNSGEHPVVMQLRSFTSAVTIGGMRYTGDQNISPPRRLIWAMLVCFGLGFAFYQISSQINYFLSNPSTVRISITEMEEMPFPTVTICNENMFNKSALNAIEPSGNLSWIMDQILPPYTFGSFNMDMEKIMEVYEKLNFPDWDDVWRKGENEALEFVLQCSYDGTKCAAEELVQVVSRMGHCIQINHHGNLTSSVPGSDNGLRLVLTADQINYNGVFSPGAGFRVFLQTVTDPPKVVPRAFRIGVNQYHQIQITNKQISRLPAPYGNCSDAENYSYHTCAARCYEQYIADNCGCRTPCFDLPGEVPICEPIVLPICFWPQTAQYQMKKLEEVICDCPYQCFDQLYPYQLSSNSFSDYFLDWVTENANINDMTRDYMKNNLLFVDIYYDHLKLEKVEAQPAYSILSLLCDVGGAMGLILGSTILTVFEVGDFIIVAVWNIFFGDIVKPNARKKQASNPSKNMPTSGSNKVEAIDIKSNIPRY